MGFEYPAEIEGVSEPHHPSYIFQKNIRIALHQLFGHIQAQLPDIFAGGDAELGFEEGRYIFSVVAEDILKDFESNLGGKVCVQPVAYLSGQGLLADGHALGMETVELFQFRVAETGGNDLRGIRTEDAALVVRA